MMGITPNQQTATNDGTPSALCKGSRCVQAINQNACPQRGPWKKKGTIGEMKIWSFEEILVYGKEEVTA